MLALQIARTKAATQQQKNEWQEFQHERDLKITEPAKLLKETSCW
jgi:hypothetical protein